MDCKLCMGMHYKFTVHKFVQNYVWKVPTSCKTTFVSLKGLTLVSMIMVSKFSNFPTKLSENDEWREYELSRSDYFIGSCLVHQPKWNNHALSVVGVGHLCTPLLAIGLKYKLHIWYSYAPLSFIHAHQIFSDSDL